MTWTVLFKDPKRIEKAVERLRLSTQVAFRKAIQDLRVEGPSPHGTLTIMVIEVSTREGAY